MHEKTGLVLDPYFSATKWRWMFEAAPETRGRAEKGEIADSVVALLGPDVILWDSELYPSSAALTASWPGERELWPAKPLAGLVAVLPLSHGAEPALFVDIERLMDTPDERHA